MKLTETTTSVPDLSDDAAHDPQGDLSNEARAEFGRAAVDVGTPDRGLNDDRTDAVDALANVMHWLGRQGLDPAQCIEAATRHYEAETETVEHEAIRILSAAGLSAHMHHSGGGIWVAEVRSQIAPGRHVWVTDSEGDDRGPFLVGAYPDSEGQPWFEATTHACTEDQLLAEVRRALAAEEN